MARMAVKTGFQGFTLSELLIALAILGVIATFTIPKVLSSQQDGKYKSMAKEVAGMLSDAYQAYRLKNTPAASTGNTNLTSYMNYVSVDTTSDLDTAQTLGGSVSCTAGTLTCLRLHNGGTLWMFNMTFNGNTSTNAIFFSFDPDGKETPGGAGPAESITFFLYMNGRITDEGGNVAPCADNSYACVAADSSKVPPWFSWN